MIIESYLKQKVSTNIDFISQIIEYKNEEEISRRIVIDTDKSPFEFDYIILKAPFEKDRSNLCAIHAFFEDETIEDILFVKRVWAHKLYVNLVLNYKGEYQDVIWNIKNTPCYIKAEDILENEKDLAKYVRETFFNIKENWLEEVQLNTVIDLTVGGNSYGALLTNKYDNKYIFTLRANIYDIDLRIKQGYLYNSLNQRAAVSLDKLTLDFIDETVTLEVSTV